jgi:predicted acylesterase/phospholipase RssA
MAGGRRRSSRPAELLADLASMTTGSSNSTPALALALSGGGSRAIAFHLGCLTAFNFRVAAESI